MIFIPGGTKDGREIIEKLLANNFRVLATTMTEYGENLIPEHKNLQVLSGKLEEKDMENLIEAYHIKAIIDATHPYAVKISENAIKASKNKGLPYFRYERPKSKYKNIKSFESFEKGAQWLRNKEGNILLTTGTNNLSVFASLLKKEYLYARVLPLSNSLKKCEELGLKPSHIIGLQGPFSKEFNRAIYKNYNIKYVVTKDSGDTGGTPAKIEAALEEDIEVIMIERPNIEYPHIYRDMDEIIKNLTLLGRVVYS